MKVFLDIDGVMVPANAWKRPTLLADGFPAFSPKAAQSLNKILSEVNPVIILTSSHKSRFSVNDWINIFRLRGIDLKDVDRLPENTTHLSRGEELMKWFGTNRLPDNFVIIDDDKSLNALPAFLKDKLILTSGLVGLTDELANQAIALLINREHSVA